MRLSTIGYEGLTSESFFQILFNNGVRHLVDVRAVAMSRKPGFAKTALTNGCLNLGLKYSHWPMLGCPSDIRAAYRINDDWDEYTESYLPYLESQTEVVRELAQLALREHCALLCFEADANFCHRLFVADALVALYPRRLNLVHLNQTTNALAAASLALAGR